MGKTIEALASHGLVALVDTPARAIQAWARAIADGGIHLFGVPIDLLSVAAVVDELADEVQVIVGVTGVVRADQLSVAMAAGAEFVCCPIADPALIGAAKARGLDVIAGAMTPTEIHAALEAGADAVAVDPAGILGPAYFAEMAKRFRGARLLAAGVDIESAPRFLELGAVGVIVDRGIFPQTREPAALEVISARARALVEVCEEQLASRIVLTVPSDRPTAPPTPLFRDPEPRVAAPRPASSVPPPIPTHARRSSRPASVPPPIPREATRIGPPPIERSVLPPRETSVVRAVAHLQRSSFVPPPPPVTRDLRSVPRLVAGHR